MRVPRRPRPRTQTEDNPYFDRSIDSLTVKPVPEDHLLFAIPVCAPYAALSDYKYKVKITPGSQKKGKASRMCVNIFCGDKGVTKREKDLLKAMTDQELIDAMVNNVKISAPNMQRAQQAAKREKKKKAKSRK